MEKHLLQISIPFHKDQALQMPLLVSEDFTMIKGVTNTPFSLRVLLSIGDVFCFEKLGTCPSAACHLTHSPSVL